MFENTDGTSLEILGEFGLIDHLTQAVELTQESYKTGIGDDAAVSDSSGQPTLITTALLLENGHCDTPNVPLTHQRYKTVQVNLSDICAMSGKASQTTLAIGFTSKTPLETIPEIHDN